MTIAARHPRRRRTVPLYAAVLVLLAATSCGPKRLAVLGPLGDPGRSAAALQSGSPLGGPTRIDFRWELNEGGARMRGVGVARLEPPYRARLDLFLDNNEAVVAAALVDDDLRMPQGAPDDVLPPVELMWGTLGVFRPMAGTRLVGGERLEGEGQRLRYSSGPDTEIHYEVGAGSVQALELVQGGSVVQWVRLERAAGDAYPIAATYRNLEEFRELKITRSSVRPSESFDPEIWDPRSP